MAKLITPLGFGGLSGGVEGIAALDVPALVTPELQVSLGAVGEPNVPPRAANRLLGCDNVGGRLSYDKDRVVDSWITRTATFGDAATIWWETFTPAVKAVYVWWYGSEVNNVFWCSDANNTIEIINYDDGKWFPFWGNQIRFKRNTLTNPTYVRIHAIAL